MLISSYNPAQAGDVLMLVVNQDQGEQAYEQKGQVVRIYAVKDQTTLGFNFLKAKSVLPDLEGQGQVFLTVAQVAKLNEALVVAGFEAELVADEEPKFVVGYVKEMTEHPDSDHLHITKIEVDGQKELQIVCGAPNIAAGQNVVVAKVGAMMPTGAIIWPGKLRGVESFGMVCSARELHLPNAPQVRGILELDATEYPAGQAFDFAKAANLFTPVQ